MVLEIIQKIDLNDVKTIQAVFPKLGLITTTGTTTGTTTPAATLSKKFVSPIVSAYFELYDEPLRKEFRMPTTKTLTSKHTRSKLSTRTIR